jgi:amino acid transporter
MLAAEYFSTGSNASTFTVVLYLATSTTLLSYLLIFPAAIKLRYSRAHVDRPYRVPLGTAGIWIAGGLCTFWMLLGAWVALFPGTIDEYVFGLPYSVSANYSVSRMRFEAFTLGTLGAIVLIALIGYWLARPVRARVVEVPSPGGAPSAQPGTA